MLERQMPDLALRHILQSGLAVMRDEPLDQDRKSKVLGALADMFSDANRGSQAIAVQNLLVAVETPPAFERFVLFFRYLHDVVGQDLPQRLLEASTTFAEAAKQNPISADAKAHVADLLDAMLKAMASDVALRPLRAPQEIRFGV